MLENSPETLQQALDGAGMAGECHVGGETAGVLVRHELMSFMEQCGEIP